MLADDLVGMTIAGIAMGLALATIYYAQKHSAYGVVYLAVYVAGYILKVLLPPAPISQRHIPEKLLPIVCNDHGALPWRPSTMRRSTPPMVLSTSQIYVAGYILKVHLCTHTMLGDIGLLPLEGLPPGRLCKAGTSPWLFDVPVSYAASSRVLKQDIRRLCRTASRSGASATWFPCWNGLGLSSQTAW